MQAPETEHRELQTGGAAGHLAEGRRELTHVKFIFVKCQNHIDKRKVPRNSRGKNKNQVSYKNQGLKCHCLCPQRTWRTPGECSQPQMAQLNYHPNKITE